MRLHAHFGMLPLDAFQPDQCGRMRLHGGGGESSSSNSTTTSTQNVDRRQVVDNGAVGITSDGGQVSINSTSTDYGSIGAAFGLADEAISGNLAAVAAAGNATERAYRDATASANASADRVVKVADSVIGAAQGGTALANDVAKRSFDLANTSSAGAYKSIEQALGYTKDVLALAKDSTSLAANSVTSAYSTAADSSTGTRFLIAAALGIAGIVAAFQLSKLKGA